MKQIYQKMEAVLTNLMRLSMLKKYSECFTLQGTPQCMAKTDYCLPAVFFDFLFFCAKTDTWTGVTLPISLCCTLHTGLQRLWSWIFCSVMLVIAFKIPANRKSCGTNPLLLHSPACVSLLFLFQVNLTDLKAFTNPPVAATNGTAAVVVFTDL